MTDSNYVVLMTDNTSLNFKAKDFSDLMSKYYDNMQGGNSASPSGKRVFKDGEEVDLQGERLNSIAYSYRDAGQKKLQAVHKIMADEINKKYEG